MPRFPKSLRAVVTGAGSGFGRAVSQRLALRGARLVLSDVDEKALTETERLVREAGAEVRCVRTDVRDPAEVEAQAALADAAFGGTDVLVNNAGVAVAGPVGDISLEDWRWQLEINLFGVIHGCHSFVPRMKAQGSGWILNVSAAGGFVCSPFMAPYNVSKAGVIALTETLYGELRDSGIRVTALCPTFFRTNIHATARATTAGVSSVTEQLVTRSKWTAEAVADIALRGLERGQLYVIPQLDGKVLWRAKRLLAQRFHDLVRLVVERWLAKPAGLR